MNGQPCSIVNLSRPPILLVVPVYWNSGIYITSGNHPQYLQARWWLVDRSYKSVYSFVWGLTSTCFSRKVCEFLLCSCFSYGKDEIWASNSLISRLKPIAFGHTGLLSSWNLMLLSSGLIIIMILACARFRSFVLSESFNPETSYWTDPYSMIRRSNHSFHDMHFHNTRSSIIHIMQNLKAYSNL